MEANNRSGESRDEQSQESTHLDACPKDRALANVSTNHQHPDVDGCRVRLAATLHYARILGYM